MNKFLEIVAKDLYSKYGNNLNRIAVVFPNRRAEFFFNNFLYKQVGASLWAPNYMTISSLIQNASTLTIADSLQLVNELYEVYKQHTHNNESLDNFYFWGELLLKDFDDIDKNLVDADSLFKNLESFKSIKANFEFLEEDQQKALEQFFTNFSIEKQSELKQKFIEIWSVLGKIYIDFKEKLKAKGIAYEGMMYREVIEAESTDISDIFTFDNYIFVGFNALNSCEKALFKLLQKENKASFYWDYDEYYVQNTNQEAGSFIRENLQDFPSELSPEYFRQFLNVEKKIRIISAPTENAQAHYLPEWINNIAENGKNIDSGSAVVLCNESLLLPTLHSLPPSVHDANITMGFPLSQTPIYDSINSLLNLHTKGFDKEKKYFYKSYILNVLQNTYLPTLSDNFETLKKEIVLSNKQRYASSELTKDSLLKLCFSPVENIENLTNNLIEITKRIGEKYSTDNQLYSESIFRTYTQINKLGDLVSSNNLNITITTFISLLRSLLFATRVPFHGEPIKGLQIMGMLETRNLDFDNILLLSANEGQLPPTSSEASFIPYNLRRSFGLNTYDKRNAVSAYYFYRMLQRAKNISICYNTSTDGMQGGEMSRFVLQLIVESKLNIELCDIQSQIKLPVTATIEINKNEAILDFLKKRYSNANSFLSPAALNTFIGCSLKFYFNYIAKLKLPEETEKSIYLIFGQTFHQVAENIYRKIDKFKTQAINEADIDVFLNNKSLIKGMVNEVLLKETNIESVDKFDGLQIIMRDAVMAYIIRLLNYDKKHTPFTILELEKRVFKQKEFENSSGKIAINIGGIVDRIDLKDGRLRILDYKTGGEVKTIHSVDELFGERRDKHYNYALQALFYSSIIASEYPEYKITQSILYINKQNDNSDSSLIKIDKAIVEDIRDIEDVFNANIETTIARLFDINEAFTQTKDADFCKYCNFKQICKR